MAQAPSNYDILGLSTLFLVPAPHYHQKRCNKGQKGVIASPTKGCNRGEKGVTAMPFSKAGYAAVLCRIFG